MAELSEEKQRARAVWSAGDFGTVAKKISGSGLKAVEAAEIAAGDNVLDVACGTGNATIPAAKTGAEVTGLDLTPKLLEEAKEEASNAGVEIEWIEGDAEQLPFEDQSFDAVISVYGAMFAPDHRAAAGEIARVLKPGGRMAVCSWTPDGGIGRFFKVTSSHMPTPPEGFQPPPLWGNEEHVREIFEGTGIELSFEQANAEFQFDSAEDVMSFYETRFGPVVIAKAMLEPDGKWQALRDDLIALYTDLNTSEEGDMRFVGEYLVAKGVKA
jgi:SAM-dependent methyltransferase